MSRIVWKPPHPPRLPSTVWINKHADLQPHLPFGGAKFSGLGSELGEEGLKEFTQVQVLNMAR